MKLLRILLLSISILILAVACKKQDAQVGEKVAGSSAVEVATNDILWQNTGTESQLFSAELLFQTKRISDIQLSPDGLWILYRLSTPSIEENKLTHDLWVSSIDGTVNKQLTNTPFGEFNARWSPDGKTIAYLAGVDGAPQIYSIGYPNAGKPKQITKEAEGVALFEWSSNGTQFLFASEVKLDQSVADIYPNLTKANVRMYEKLPVRHWDEWTDDKYSHIFVVPTSGGTAKDLMPNEKYDSPLKPFGGVEEVEWSPENNEIAYTCKKVDDYALSTNSDIYLVNPADNATKNITADNKGYDKYPLYSPDGNWIAYQSQERPGFESDKIRLMLYNRKNGETKFLSSTLDQWVEEFVWAPDSKSIYFVANDSGTVQLYSISVPDGNWKVITDGPYAYGHGLAITPDGKTLVTGRNTFVDPLDIFTINIADGKATQVTNTNKELYSTIKKCGIKEQWFDVSDGAKVHTWIVFPPDFNPNKKYPMITYCQGGPQSQINPNFHYRWNLFLMASKGYIVVASNRRGVPGFGQAWNDAISRDWGGRPMQDFLDITDAMATQKFVDKDALSAVGASAGGYAAFWLAGHHEKRFKAFISHCGVYNFESMYGETEELFFSNWEYGGPYWDPDHKPNYDQNSPHNFVQNWDTPILIITGERDFRVPYTQSLEAFTAAQVKNIPSKLLIYPEETHFVAKPQNYLIWSAEFYGWLDKYCKK